MKKMILLLSFVTAPLAFADSFVITQNGRNYLCQEQANPNPTGAADCANKAYHGPFSTSQAQQLCKGALNTGPADCGITAYHGPFSTEQAISLCTGAANTGPADCANKAYHGPFSTEQALRLCKGGTVATADCALKAYHGPFSTEEAIDMCKAQPIIVFKNQKMIDAKSVDKKIEILNSKIK